MANSEHTRITAAALPNVPVNNIFPRQHKLELSIMRPILIVFVTEANKSAAYHKDCTLYLR